MGLAALFGLELLDLPLATFPRYLTQDVRSVPLLGKFMAKSNGTIALVADASSGIARRSRHGSSPAASM